MLYLVGENLDKTRAHYQAETGKILQLMRGVYVSTDDDIDLIVLRHAVRIARYLYPRAYLSAASAILLAPTNDGRLFISGPRKQRTRIRALEIIQNAAPKQPSTAAAIIKDDLGEFRVDVSSVRQRFLEAFRHRSEHAASIDNSMRQEISQRLIEEHRGTKTAADAVWALARENGWYREAELAERYLLKAPSVVEVQNQATLRFIVAWHAEPVGELFHDGFEWRWKPEPSFHLPLIQQRTPGQLPLFIQSLLPEGWLERVLKDSDERALLRSGKRYMSNITICEAPADLAKLPSDTLNGRLADHTKEGVFSGDYAGPKRDDIESDFETNLARIYKRSDTPRLSGVQIKAPMFLDGSGSLVASSGQPFTHILKPAGTSGFQSLPTIEYLAMELGRSAGLEVPPTALINMPDDMPPALLVERFDIRRSVDDNRRIALEDLCSVLNLSPDAKYDGTMERITRAIRPLSTSTTEDLISVIRRALFAWLIADGDMHLKNLALLKIALPKALTFNSVRLAPLYDAVTTRVFPGLGHDRMALTLNGKDNRLRRADFTRLAATAGISATQTNAAIDHLLEGFSAGLADVVIPRVGGLESGIVSKAEQMLKLCGERVSGFS